jgi:hypothetical protein
MSRSGPAVVLLALLAFASPAAAYTLRFEASTAEAPFHARSCVPDTRGVRIPLGATHVHPGALVAYDGDSSVGTFLEGPRAFADQPSFSDEDEYGDYDILEYATITEFDVRPGRAVWTAAASSKWCAGYTGDPRKPHSPRPASRQAHPQRDPTYHRGWATTEYGLQAVYTLTRKRIWTLDPKGTLRSAPPARLAASHKHDLVVDSIVWRGWGKAHPVGHGLVSYNGGSVRATIYADYLTVATHLPGCGGTRVFYDSLTIAIPKIADRSTDYRVGQHCTRAVSNGDNPIDQALAGS